MHKIRSRDITRNRKKITNEILVSIHRAFGLSYKANVVMYSWSDALFTESTY